MCVESLFYITVTVTSAVLSAEYHFCKPDAMAYLFASFHKFKLCMFFIISPDSWKRQ